MDEIGKAIIQLRMKEVPEANYSELQKQMIAHGYNPDEPKIDSRFLVDAKSLRDARET